MSCGDAILTELTKLADAISDDALTPAFRQTKEDWSMRLKYEIDRVRKATNKDDGGRPKRRRTNSVATDLSKKRTCMYADTL